MSDFNTQVIDEFRANNGKVGGMFEGNPVMLLTATGAKSGKRRTLPLVYTKDGDRIVIIASKGGGPTNPDWYHNLIANPTATVEIGDDKWEARVEEVHGEERDRLYKAQAELMPGFAEYELKTMRKIPVLTLERVR